MRIKFLETTNAETIVSLADTKEFLRVGGSSDDDLITALRAAAIQYVEGHCNTHLGSVEAAAYMDHFAPTRFPIGPVTSVDSISYLDIGGNSQTLSTSTYYTDLQSDVARIEFDNPPTLFDHGFNKITMTIQVGFAVASIPASVIHALKLLVSHFYDNRQVYAAGRNIGEIPFAVSALLNSHRFL